jgi:glycosyltransferase involved in cell wall biosynthesis
MHNTDMKVLISAYFCEPDSGGESAVGWNSVCQAARFHEVWVITRTKSQALIEKSSAREPLANVHWVFFDLPSWGRFWEQSGISLRAYYCLWQLAIYFVARKLHRRVGFELAHHVTIGSSWYPTFLAFLPLPFIWGPVGAGSPCPRIFHREFSVRGRTDEWAREVLLAISSVNPIRRQTEKRASVILAISPVTVGQLSPKSREKALIFSQVGVDSKEIEMFPERRCKDGGRFRLLSVGRFVHWKGFALGIKAFALFNQKYPNSEYCIVGDGPERDKLRELVSSLGLSGAVQFPGSLSREDYLHQLLQSDVLLHAGLHEPGAYVIAEAMAARLPIICPDFGEPASIVTSETGIKIPLSSPKGVVAGISEACIQLATNPSLCVRMGDAGRQRVLEFFEWNGKGRLMVPIYEGVVRECVPAAKIPARIPGALEAD